MRTTVDLPDALFRKTKVAAALRGVTLKEVVIHAIEKEVTPPVLKQQKRLKLPLIQLRAGNTINLRGFDFDDLLA